MTTKQLLLFIGSALAILYVWEYAALRRGYEVYPSLGFTFVSTKAKLFWETCGIWAAWLSSFLTVFDFTDMVKAAKQLVIPVWDTVTSWIYFPIGYVSEMNLYDHPYVVVLGSIMAVSAICYLMYYFDQWKRFTPMMNRFSSWCAPISDGSMAEAEQEQSSEQSQEQESVSVSVSIERPVRKTPGRKRRNGY